MLTKEQALKINILTKGVAEDALVAYYTYEHGNFHKKWLRDKVVELRDYLNTLDLA
jgi:hypothetical protein